MLTLIVGSQEAYNESEDKFTNVGGFEIQLEHSLVSISKWESIYEKPFLIDNEKTPEEAKIYVKCMVLTENPPENFIESLSEKDYDKINEYLDRKMTATWFSEQPGAPKANREIVTSELIYYWMTAFNIPSEYQYWPLNRLFTLIRICNLKQDNKPKKMSRAEVARRNRELNEQRKKQLGTKG